MIFNPKQISITRLLKTIGLNVYGKLNISHPDMSGLAVNPKDDWLYLGVKSLKQVSEAKGDRIRSAAFIGSGNGIETIVALKLFPNLEVVYVTDLLPDIQSGIVENIQAIAKEELKNVRLECLTGRDCHPLPEKVDLIFANLPIIMFDARDIEKHHLATTTLTDASLYLHLSQGDEDPLKKWSMLSQLGFLLSAEEKLNPGGTVLTFSGTIVEASSGNQGIAIAMIGAIKGYKVIITASEKISEEKLKTMRAYGATVVLCPPTDFIDDPRGYHSKAIVIHKETPNSFMPDQYFNLANSRAHYTMLGPEIWKQTDGKITHFFAAAGTSGTISGAGKYLKEQNPNIKVIAVDVATSYHATHGNPKPYKMEGVGMDFDTPIFDENVIDEIIPVTDEQGLGMLKTMTHTHGLLVGPSSGAVAFAIQAYAKRLDSNAVVVMIFGDSGRAYLSKEYYS